MFVPKLKKPDDSVYVTKFGNAPLIVMLPDNDTVPEPFWVTLVDIVLPLVVKVCVPEPLNEIPPERLNVVLEPNVRLPYKTSAAEPLAVPVNPEKLRLVK